MLDQLKLILWGNDTDAFNIIRAMRVEKYASIQARLSRESRRGQ
jgi:hypothetical protein